MNRRSLVIFGAYFAAVAALSTDVFEGDNVKAVLAPAQFAPAIEVLHQPLDEDNAFVERNVFAGAPQLMDSWNHGPTEYVVREGYVLEHSAWHKIPLWVSEKITREQLVGDAERQDKFKEDPLLKSLKSFKADYKGSGFDRGHQAPAGDQKESQLLNDETFFLSNMAPQAPGLNRNIWRVLEEKIRAWVLNSQAGNERFAYVITGCMFYDPAEEDFETADGLVGYLRIGRRNVAVPTHFFKIVIAPDGTGQMQSLAFVLENRSYKSPYSFRDHLESIDWIEDRTGINFFSAFVEGSSEEERLERRVSPYWLE